MSASDEFKSVGVCSTGGEAITHPLKLCRRLEGSFRGVQVRLVPWNESLRGGSSTGHVCSGFPVVALSHWLAGSPQWKRWWSRPGSLAGMTRNAHALMLTMRVLRTLHTTTRKRETLPPVVVVLYPSAGRPLTPPRSAPSAQDQSKPFEPPPQLSRKEEKARPPRFLSRCFSLPPSLSQLLTRPILSRTFPYLSVPADGKKVAKPPLQDCKKYSLHKRRR